eukprot:TRINITY_DN11300_c1_g1_i1.p1 TRINITY_DN11300_c1_g1~~TRINITY_DN11300_c1_g1_i1.p1  ORF type:complete len:112 (-),score=12.82 TRINITY_DN11300_c1_g1_i1:130-465(-)
MEQTLTHHLHLLHAIKPSSSSPPTIQQRVPISASSSDDHPSNFQRPFQRLAASQRGAEQRQADSQNRYVRVFFFLPLYRSFSFVSLCSFFFLFHLLVGLINSVGHKSCENC